MKICVECKHCLLGSSENAAYAKCMRFKSLDEVIPLVIGQAAADKLQLKYPYCTTARDFADMCGREGTKWEPKEEVKP